MMQKQGEKNVTTDWRDELHKAQTKVNTTEHALKMLDSAYAKKFKKQGAEVRLHKALFKVIGGGIIVADLFKDGISQANTWQFQGGMGWMQITVLAVGFIFLFVGFHRQK